MELLPGNIGLIDTGYIKPGMAASYLIQEGGAGAFIETGTARTLPALLAAAKDAGLGRSDVRYIIVTHVHLDHAGGAWALMKEFPDARLLVHPHGVRHMADPSLLVESAQSVYGVEQFSSLYGDIESVEEARIDPVEDGVTVSLGGRKLRFLHTAGHSYHHICVLDEATRGIFTGDSFGLAYRVLQPEQSEHLPHSLPFIYPAATPTQFEPDLAMVALEQICATGARTAYLTHFGPISNLEGTATRLREGLIFLKRVMNELAHEKMEGEELAKELERRIGSEYREMFLKDRGRPPDHEEWSYIALDVGLNASGLAYAIQRMRKKKTKS